MIPQRDGVLLFNDLTVVFRFAGYTGQAVELRSTDSRGRLSPHGVPIWVSPRIFRFASSGGSRGPFQAPPASFFLASGRANALVGLWAFDSRTFW